MGRGGVVASQVGRRGEGRDPVMAGSSRRVEVIRVLGGLLPDIRLSLHEPVQDMVVPTPWVNLPVLLPCHVAIGMRVFQSKLAKGCSLHGQFLLQHSILVLLLFQPLADLLLCHVLVEVNLGHFLVLYSLVVVGLVLCHLVVEYLLLLPPSPKLSPIYSPWFSMML